MTFKVGPLRKGAWPVRTAHINGVTRNFFPALASSPEDVRIPVCSQVRVWVPTCLHLLPLFSGWALTVLPAAQSNRWTKHTESSCKVEFLVFWNVNLLILECASFSSCISELKAELFPPSQWGVDHIRHNGEDWSQWVSFYTCRCAGVLLIGLINNHYPMCFKEVFGLMLVKLW